MPKGWDREGIRFRSRPTRAPRDVSRVDLCVPDSVNRLVLFASCVACGAMIAVLLGWFGQMFVTLFLGFDSGTWFWWVVLAVGVISTLGLYVFAMRDRARDAEWLERY